MTNEIKCIKGELKIPFEWRRIRMPWQIIIQGKPDKFGMVCEKRFYRYPPKKPYVPHGKVEIDGKLYEIKKVKKR